MVTYALPIFLFTHFVFLSLIILGNGISGFTDTKKRIIGLIGYGMVLFSMIFIFVIVFFPFPVDLNEISFNTENHYGQINNFIPLKTILSSFKDLFDGYQSIFVYQIIGNIILFMPLGFSIHILLFHIRKKFFKTTILCTLTSLSIEIMQGVYSMLLGYTYRSMDIDDLLLNIIGGMLGFLCTHLLYLYLYPKQEK